MSNIGLSSVIAIWAVSTILLPSIVLVAVLIVRTPDLLPDVLRISAKMLIALTLLGICLFVMPGFGLIAWLVIMAVWIRTTIHLRSVQKRSLFGALALAVDKQMPLAPMALAFANEQCGGFGRSAHALADRLSEGVPLVDAIAKSRGALPP
ncbi:MAG TPA: hypothetical protein VGZ26_04055, partial [Pirellulales bacterium]|nr:hypothetical protein [Pirellulales bacterium]